MTAAKDRITELQTSSCLASALPAISPQLPPVAQSPHSDAKLGRDPQGNPAWLVADSDRPGKYL